MLQEPFKHRKDFDENGECAGIIIIKNNDISFTVLKDKSKMKAEF
jgi:hypothetical protein